MIRKLIKAALIGKTNAGKSTFINSLVGEKISIINKKINTTQESILGIKNFKDIQIVFYDTPGTNFLKTTNLTQKKLKTNLWQAIYEVDYLIYIVDVYKYDYQDVDHDILKISEVKKPIIFVFNKIDKIENKKILSYIDELRHNKNIDNFFMISAKYNDGIDVILKFLNTNAYKSNWLFNSDIITNKDDIFISNECTRNAILDYIHQEIPYNVLIENKIFKFLKKNELKIKQIIKIDNPRYKPIILGKNGETIKKIREKSQKEIGDILNCKIHLYLNIEVK